LRLQEGSILEPTSTKNKSGARDPEMRQTKKGNEWHIGVDEMLELIHNLTTTAKSEHYPDRSAA